MRMFLTPDKTFSVSVVWSEDLRTFVPVPPKDGEPIFEMATPDEKMAHENYFALLCIPNGDSGYAPTQTLVWGKGSEKGLVRSVRNAPKGFAPTPALTLALARICREEAGMATPMHDPKAQAVSAEGNCDSPSGSGSDSTPSPAGNAETQTTVRP